MTAEENDKATGASWSPFTAPKPDEDSTRQPHPNAPIAPADPHEQITSKQGPTVVTSSDRTVGDDVVDELEDDDDDTPDEPEHPDDSEEEKKRKQAAAQRKRKRTLARKKRDQEAANASEEMLARVGNLADRRGPNMQPGQDVEHPEELPDTPRMIGGVEQSDSRIQLLPVADAPEAKPVEFDGVRNGERIDKK